MFILGEVGVAFCIFVRLMKFKLCDTDFLPLSVACASGGAEEAGRRSWDELHHVGLPEDVDVQSLFDESGDQQRGAFTQ